MRLARLLLIAMIAVCVALLSTSASADVDNSSATNVQDGDNDSDTAQQGGSASGDAVGGQISGTVSEGSTSVDATNESDDVDIETGPSTATNEASHLVGHNATAQETRILADITNVTGLNVQDGNNTLGLSQAANASSGDGVGGQVIGAVTSAGGSAAIVAQNTSTEIDITTGDATAANTGAAFVGLQVTSGGVVGAPLGADITNASASNVQDGDNSLTGELNADANSGDGVGGQVIGVVTAGTAELDATNVSDDIDLATGDATAASAAARFVGLNFSTDEGLLVFANDVTGSTAQNLQEGDNAGAFSHSARASTGDAVGGQISGVVTSAGGTVDVALDNTSTEIDGATGGARFANNDAGFIGLNVSSGTNITSF